MRAFEPQLLGEITMRTGCEKGVDEEKQVVFRIPPHQVMQVLNSVEVLLEDEGEEAMKDQEKTLQPRKSSLAESKKECEWYPFLETELFEQRFFFQL